MNHALYKSLVCPIDKGPLDLHVFAKQTRTLQPLQKNIIHENGWVEEDFTEDVISGVLINPRKGLLFPLYNAVPRLLTFHHPLVDSFKEKFSKKLENFSNYRFPNFDLIPGERDVLRTFSTEWQDYGVNEGSYWAQEPEVYNKCLLFTTGVDEIASKPKTVLEVGIGSGDSANFMRKHLNCRQFGIDLSYAVDVAAKNFDDPFMHIVQSSIFNIPFKDESFDFVYSHGVIHHTYNTEKAFEQLAQLPKKNGGLYLWVYSPVNENRNFKRRLLMTLENGIRKWCWRLPALAQSMVLTPLIPLYIIHQFATRDKSKGMVNYGFKQAMHAARDRFTPRYVHRHSEEEVKKWFLANQFSSVVALSELEIPEYVPVSFYANTGVRGIKS